MDGAEKNIKITDVCIIGAGVVGMFLASRCIKSGMSVSIIENNRSCGGQINLYSNKTIYNIPLIRSIKGSDIIANLEQELSDAKDCSVFLSTFVIDLKKTENDYYRIYIKKNDNITIIECKYLVLAFGKGRLEPNKLVIDNLDKIENKTLFYSVDNKERFLKKNIVIVGGGDSVIDWSCELSEIANKIIVIHRREIDRPENPRFFLFKNLCENKKILLKTQFNIVNFLFKNDNFTGIEISNNEIYDKIYCDYILVFFGLKNIQNNFDIYKNIGIKFDSKGVLVNSISNETDCRNIFAIGDCCSYSGKIDNIFIGFSDAIKCYYEICHRKQYNISSKHD